MTYETKSQPFRVRQAAGDFIAKYGQWRWWITVTFKRDVSRREADEALRVWLRWIAREHVQTHVRVAYCIEPTKTQRWHVHLLLDARDEYMTDVPDRVLDPDEVRDQWRHLAKFGGFSKIVRYRSSGGAAHYITKHSDWNAGTVCTREARCRRKGGCRHGTAPW